ncbi:MAG: Arm DNA-binding domain-containing protein, partial [Sulfuritalea sp.]|nr:Arm DNA-binding domain-containing protein [Sulfuritalea sp.]
MAQGFQRFAWGTTMALSDTGIRKAKFIDKPFKLADDKGLYLLVNQQGKYWRQDYRYFGKRKTMALGVYPDTSLAKAREKRDSARTLLADGVDPGENKKAQRAARMTLNANSFEVITREWMAK